MEIAVTLFGVLIAGLLGAYVAIIYRAFQFSRDLETDFNVIVQNVKTRELSDIRDFVEGAISEGIWAANSKLSPNQKRLRDERVKKLMEERWKNAYSCYKAEALIDKLQQRESRGQKWCIIGIICVLISFVVYLLPLGCVNTLKISGVLLLSFYPLLL